MTLRSRCPAITALRATLFSDSTKKTRTGSSSMLRTILTVSTKPRATLLTTSAAAGRRWQRHRTTVGFCPIGWPPRLRRRTGWPVADSLCRASGTRNWEPRAAQSSVTVLSMCEVHHPPQLDAVPVWHDKRRLSYPNEGHDKLPVRSTSPSRPMTHLPAVSTYLH